jgi:hypothetical protein
VALTTYGGLKTAISDWAWGEVTAAQIASDFFPRMQSALYYGHGDGRDGLVQIKPLRIRDMEDTATLTPSAAGEIDISTACGSGWLNFITLQPSTVGAQSLDYVTPFEFKKRTELAYGGPANFYTIEGDTLKLGPYGSTTLYAHWHEKFTALSGDSDVDWVLTNAPQVYMDGCLMEVCTYLQDDRYAQFRSNFAAGINALNRNNAVSKMAGGVMRAVPRNYA